MHGYDKLTLTLEENTQSLIPLVLLKDDVLNRASNIRYRITTPNEWGRIKLSPLDTDNFGNIYLIIRKKKLPYSNQGYAWMVHQIELNPNHFINYQAIEDCLYGLDNTESLKAIEHAYINRLDINADNDLETLGGDGVFLSHISVPRKQYLKTYFSNFRGQPETNYNGTGSDIIMLYDRGAKLESLSEDPAEYTNLGRVERKLSKPRIIKSSLKQPNNHIYLSDLPYITEEIINGTINPLKGVRFGNPAYPTASSLTHTQAVTLGKIQEASVLGGFNLAKKRYKGDVVFKKCQFNLLPDNQQPTAILRRTLTNFI